MKLRKLHRMVAITLSPLLFLLAITGCLLFFRKAGLYNKEIKELIISIHTWEIIMPYVGLVVGGGLLFIVISGVILFFKPRA